MDRRKVMFAAIGISAIILGIAYSPYLLLVPTLLYLLGGTGRRKESALSAKRLESVSSRLIARLIARGRSLISQRKEFFQGQASKAPSWIPIMLKRKALGEMNSDTRNAGELQGILASYLDTGKGIQHSLSLLSKRLDTEIRTEEKFFSKANGLKSLTYLGLSFFLPLFAGISSGILGTSLGFIGDSAAGLQQGFLCVVLGYIGIVMYLTASFSNPQEGISTHIGTVLPSFSLSAFIMLITVHYATAIL